jgi:predicted RNA-binding protein YlxR (DUF448 family)
MGVFEIETPNGTFEVEAPDQATALEAIGSIQANPAQQEQASSDDEWITGTIIPMRSKGTWESSEFAWPKIITEPIDVVKNSIDMVGKVRSGETPIMDPISGHTNLDVVNQVTDLATIATPAARGGGLMRGAPKPRKAPKPLTEGQNAAVAADRLGVEMPRAVASDSMTTNQFGKTATSMPIVGNPLRKSSQKAIDQIGDAATRVQDKLGTGDRVTAGGQLRTGITKSATETMPNKVSKLYDKVDGLVDGNVHGDLIRTRRTAAMIDARNANAALPKSQATKFIDNAIKSSDGMNYEGIKSLRTRIGEMLKNPDSLANSSISETELKSIYKSLTKDMEAIVNKSGPEARKAWTKANAKAAKTAKARKILNKVLGTNKSDEKIVDDLVAMASTNSRANANTLMRVRNSVDKETWDEFASSALAKMGRDAEGNFSPDRFVTAWGKTSKTGKSLLFGGGEVSKALDDIAAVSSRFKKMNDYANPSGTGQSIAVQAAVGTAPVVAAFAEPLTLLATLSTGATTYGISRQLSKPSSAKKIAGWAKVYEQAAKNPSVGKARTLNQLSKNLAIEIGIDKSLAKEFAARTLAAVNMTVPEPAIKWEL